MPGLAGKYTNICHDILWILFLVCYFLWKENRVPSSISGLTITSPFLSFLLSFCTCQRIRLSFLFEAEADSGLFCSLNGFSLISFIRNIIYLPFPVCSATSFTKQLCHLLILHHITRETQLEGLNAFQIVISVHSSGELTKQDILPN